MVELQPSKLAMRVRFPSPAPTPSGLGTLHEPLPELHAAAVVVEADQEDVVVLRPRRPVRMEIATPPVRDGGIVLHRDRVVFGAPAPGLVGVLQPGTDDRIAPLHVLAERSVGV